MKHFNISFVVSEAMLTTVISVLSGHSGKLSISEVDNTKRDVAGLPQVRKPGLASKPTSRSKSWALMVDHISKIAPGKEILMEDLGKLLVKHGFTASSASPMGTHLVREGLVTRKRQGVLEKV